VADPNAKVEVKTKNEIGKLTAKMVIPLGPYTGDAVVVRLDDADSQPIAIRSLLALPPLGASGTKWRFKSKADGLQQVQLKSLEAKQPGMSQIVVKTKRWFTAAAANDPTPGANTRLTITFGGTQCYTHVLTKKTD
jgi:hypothetical protein